MKSQNLFRAMHVMVLLVSFISINQPAHASTSSVDKLGIQILNRDFPESQDIMQVQPMISMVVTPPGINIGGTATVTVNLNNVPIEGYTSIELTCTYYPNLVEARDIVVADLFGADPVIAIRGPQYDRFIVAIAGSHGNKATNSGTLMTFRVRGLQPGLFPLECQARVSTGNHALTNIAPISNDILVLAPTPTSKTGFCDSAEFVGDVNVPPGTIMSQGETFIKTWRLQNVGTCAWTTSYQIVFFSGDQMRAPASFTFPVNVAVGNTVDFSLNMIAPNTVGNYQGNWMIKNANGVLFGIGPHANQPFSVNIVVSGATATATPSSPTPSITPGGLTNSPTPSVTPDVPSNTPTPSITPSGPIATPVAGVAFDFAANVCTALWFSGAGQLPCPGNDGDPNGFVLKLNNPILETGVTDTRPGLLTFPQNGYIQGFYPPFHVQNGDRFRSIIGCEFGATSCYIAFRLDYQIGTDSIKTLWGPFLERYDGQYYSVDVDLSQLDGKDVKFILTLISAGSPNGDRAEWVNPIIYRASTSTPSATPAGNWLTFTNLKYGFQFAYPENGQLLAGNTDTYARINLPIIPATNLSEKYLEVIVGENANPCQSPLATQSQLETSEPVNISGLSFLKQTGGDAGAGNIYQWVAYSIFRNNVCVSLDFILHSHNPDIYPTPPPLFDYEVETAVFGQIASTYMWLTLAPTSTPTFTSTPVPTTGTLTGHVLAGRPVTVSLYDGSNNLVISVSFANPDGLFSFTTPVGTYSARASASGYFSAQGSVTITGGNTTILPTITLPAGDIDGNNVIDQFDVLTIGMNYNGSTPAAADLNNDGIINVLDLELLAKNYREAGPLVWQ